MSRTETADSFGDPMVDGWVKDVDLARAQARRWRKEAEEKYEAGEYVAANAAAALALVWTSKAQTTSTVAALYLNSGLRLATLA